MAIPESQLPLTQSLSRHLLTQSLPQICNFVTDLLCALQEAVAIPESELSPTESLCSHSLPSLCHRSVLPSLTCFFF